MRGCVPFILIASTVVEPVTVAQAGERAAAQDQVVLASGARNPAQRTIKDERSSARTALDRVAYAVDGAESSHGEDRGMWGPDLSGPQGPMQVTEAAAADVGGGDRFDLNQNRAIGRDYLALLFGRYKNWPDAIAAYNWGMGNVDAWIKAGRPADKFLVGVAVYLRRVLHDSGMCGREAPGPVRQPPHSLVEDVSEAVAFTRTVCAHLDPWEGWPVATDRRFISASSRFRSKLDQAARLAAQHLPASQRRDP
jgi:hypothetical protein